MSECGCKVVFASKSVAKRVSVGGREWSKEWKPSEQMSIQYCPLHANAEKNAKLAEIGRRLADSVRDDDESWGNTENTAREFQAADAEKG